MREVRKLTDFGHQTSLISTAYSLLHLALAACMFSRWCQENFFGYMMHHFAIDLLAIKSLQTLFDQLNESELIYPGTDMRIVYELGGLS